MFHSELLLDCQLSTPAAPHSTLHQVQQLLSKIQPTLKNARLSLNPSCMHHDFMEWNSDSSDILLRFARLPGVDGEAQSTYARALQLICSNAAHTVCLSSEPLYLAPACATLLDCPCGTIEQTQIPRFHSFRALGLATARPKNGMAAITGFGRPASPNHQCWWFFWKIFNAPRLAPLIFFWINTTADFWQNI